MENDNIIKAGRPLSSAVVLGAALGGLLLFASAGPAQAGAPTTDLLWDNDSKVTDTVTDNLDGTWDYDYTVFNTSTSVYTPGANDQEPILVDWELPWFDDYGDPNDPNSPIREIRSPGLWNWSIETIGVANPSTGWLATTPAEWQDPADPWYTNLGLTPDSPFVTHTKVLHWYNECWFGGELNVPSSEGSGTNEAECRGQFDGAIDVDFSLDSFGFTAVYDATPAPYQASWATRPVRTGDPAFPLIGGVPASPDALGLTAVSEPSTLAAAGLALSLGGLAGLRRRRRNGERA